MIYIYGQCDWLYAINIALDSPDEALSFQVTTLILCSNIILQTFKYKLFHI